jgi:hypothetical protein
MVTVTPTNVIRLAAVVGLVSLVVVLATADRQMLATIPAWVWSVTKTFAYVGIASTAMVILEAGLYWVKRMRAGLHRLRR